MTSRSDPPVTDTALTPELIPLATELEEEMREYPQLEGAAEEAIMDEAPEAALPEDIEELPDDDLGTGETSAEGGLPTSDDLDEDAAARALEAADIDLTGIDPVVLGAEPYAGESAEVGVDDAGIETLIDVPLNDFSEDEEALEILDVEVPLMTMGFGDPGIPVPEGFDPATFATDPEKMDEMQVEAAFLDVEDAFDIQEIVGMAVSEHDGIPPWPFETDDIPEVR